MNHQKLLQQTTCLALIAILLVGCGGMQGQPTTMPTHIPPAAPPAPAPILHARDYWPTKDWKESSPEEQGMDSNLLQKVQPYINERLPGIRSILIVRHGYLVFEQYYQGADQDRGHSLRSVTKSFVSALIGIALKEGYLKSLDQKMVDLLPEYVTPDMDPRTREITLKHLLTMTSGFICPHEDCGPVEPGKSFGYNVISPDILSRILTKVTNMSTLEFANKYLFEPLGIAEPFWAKDSLGYDLGGYGLNLRPRDMAKFGYLYLNQGVWEGKQTVPSDFVRASTQKQNEGGPPVGVNYGYLWWVTTIEGHAAYFAAGFQGQYIYIVPDWDIVVVITSDSDPQKENGPMVIKLIISAITK